MEMGPERSPRQRRSEARRRVERQEGVAGGMSTRWFAGITAIFAAALLLLVMALSLGFCLVRMAQYSGREQVIQDGLNETIVLQDALETVSATTRDYIVWSNSSLLAQRQKAKQAVQASLAVLAANAAGDSLAAAGLGELERAIAGRIRLLDQIVADARLPDMETHLQDSEIERIHIDRLVIAKLSAFRAHKRNQLEVVERHLARSSRLAIWLALLAGLAVPLCGFAGLHLLRCERQNQYSRELQLELMHVQRLAIIGETSAMLAHEINQPLTAASNYLSVLRRHLAAGAPDKAETMAERIARQIQRAAGIVRKLRGFIEKRETERERQSPEILIEDAITLLGTIDNSIHLKTEIGPRLPFVLVDRVQLQQVLVNLLRNAIEAMQDCPSRALSLTAFASDGQTVEISLADSGPGLAPEIAGRLFEPFVSTKENGMGVGLSICKSIIVQHGGRIWADPNPAGGAIFRFTLPAAESPHAAVPESGFLG